MNPPTREALAAYAEDQDIELLFLDPGDIFDAAILGLCIGFGQEPAVLYDLARVRTRMAAAMPEASLDEVEEFLQFNTLGAYVGPATPRFLERPDLT